MSFSAWLNSIHLIVIGMISTAAGMTVLHAYLVMSLLNDVSETEQKAAGYGLGFAISVAVMLCSIHKKILGANWLPIFFALLAWNDYQRILELPWRNPKGYLIGVFAGFAEYAFALLFTNKWEIVRKDKEKIWRDLMKEVDELTRKKRDYGYGIAEVKQELTTEEQKLEEIKRQVSEKERWVDEHSCVCGFFNPEDVSIRNHKNACQKWKARNELKEGTN